MDGSSKNFLLTSFDIPQHTTSSTAPTISFSSSIELEGYGKCSFCECTQYFAPSIASQKSSKECCNCPHSESLHVKLRLTLSTRESTPVAVDRNRRLSISMPNLHDGYGTHSLVPNSLKIDLQKDSFSDNLQAFNDDFKWNRVQEEEVLNSVNKYVIDHYASLFTNARQQRGILTDHDWDVIIDRYIPPNFLRIIDQTKSTLIQKYERLSFQLLMLHQYNFQNDSNGNLSAISWRYRIDTLKRLVEENNAHIDEIDKRRYRIILNLLLKKFNGNEVTKNACFQENAIAWNDQDKDKQKKIDECRQALASMLPDLVSSNQKIWITSKLYQSEAEFQERLSILLLYLQNPCTEICHLDFQPILALYKITENFANQLREMIDGWDTNDGLTIAQTNVTAPLFVISRPKFVTTYREYFIWMTKIFEFKSQLPAQIVKLVDLPRQRLRRYADFVNAFLELQPLDAQNNHMNIVRFSLITALNDIQSLLSFSYNVTDYENALKDLAQNYPEFSRKNLLFRRIGKLSVSTAKDSQSSSREDLFESTGEKSTKPKKVLRLYLFDDGLLIENLAPQDEFDKSFQYRIFPVENVKAVVINRAGRTSSNTHTRGRFRIVINEPDKSIRDLFQDFEQPSTDNKSKRRSLYSVKSKSLGATLHGFSSSNSLVDSQTTVNDITIKFKVATREEAMMWVHDITSSVDLFKREEPANNINSGRESAEYGSSLRRKQIEGFTWKKFLNLESKDKDKDKEKEPKEGKSYAKAATLRAPRVRGGELTRTSSSSIYPVSSKSTTAANPVFGVPLKTVISRPSESGVPFVVQECANYILLKGLQTEGIFRISAQHKQLDTVAKLFDDGLTGFVTRRLTLLGKITSLFDLNLDIHLVCGLLTKYLRDLPTPLTENYHGAFMVCQKAIDKQIEANQWTKGEEVEILIPKYRDICGLLPPENYELLKYLIRFLGEIAEHSAQNKMHVKNLATIFGPLLLHTMDTDPPASTSDVRKSISDKMAESLLQSNIVENFLVHRQGIFEDKRRHSII